MKTFPYEGYEQTKLWQVVDLALSDLSYNNDIIEHTDRKYITGYLVKTILDSKCVKKLIIDQ